MVLSNTLDISWNTSGFVSNGLSISWYTGRAVSTLLNLQWNTQGNPPPVGVAPVFFTAMHTGEFNSGQVIRLRSFADINRIVYESPVETLTDGYIITKVDNESLDDRRAVRAASYTRTTTLQQLGKDIKKIGISDLPAFVYQEYKSSDQLRHIIRYMGIVYRDPYKSINSSLKRVNIAQEVLTKGAMLGEVNRTGLKLQFTFNLSNGQKFTGVLPVGACLAFVKSTDTTYKVGYVFANAIGGFAGPGIGIPIEVIQNNFQTFSSGGV